MCYNCLGYKVNCMVYIVHMAFITCGTITLTCNGTLHYVCMGTSHFMGVGAWLGSNTEIGDLMSELGTIGRSPIELHGFIKQKTWSGNSKKG